MKCVSEIHNCTACGACRQICPVGAISILEDKLFYEVVVDQKKCIQCGKCLHVCPVNQVSVGNRVITAYGAVNKNADVVALSSSGGVFSAVAEYILCQNGVVFGACYSDDCKSVKIRHTDEVSLEELRRSKYVESHTGNSYSQAEAFLKTGRKVLYCGAPCQIAGLIRYLGCDYDNLFTCDFSCGGMASHTLFRQYLRELERKYGSTVRSVNFRPKIFGWDRYCIRIIFENGKKYVALGETDPYFCSFLHKHYSTRDNCHHCDFSVNHSSDLILADLWKHGLLKKMKNDNTGLSLVLVTSPKGESLLESVRDCLDMEQIALQDAMYNLIRKERSADFFEKRQLFLDCCGKFGLQIAAKRYCLPTKWRILQICIKTRIRRFLKGKV